MSIDGALTHEILRSAIDAVPQAVVLIDSEGRIGLWSLGAQRLLGWTPAEVVGRPISDIVPGLEAPDPGERFLDGADATTTLGAEFEVIHRDGRVIPVATAVTLVPGPPGSSPAVIAVSDDSRSLAELEQEADALSTHLRLALDAGGFGTWRWDLATGVTVWDGEMERLFGLPPGAFDGTFEAWKALVHPDDWDDVMATLDHALETRGSYRLVHRINVEDGPERWIEGAGRVTLDRDGEVTGTVGCCHDVTERAALDAERDRLQAVADASWRAERLQRQRLEMVTAVNEALEDSEDLRDLMRRVTRAVVPGTADWCALHIFESPHSDEPLVEVAHRDPAMVRFARDVLDRHPYDPEARNGVAEVIRTRRPAFYPAIDEEMIAASGATDEQQALVRRLSLRSAIAVPLVKRGRVFGALQLVMTGGSRAYSDDDLALAEVLAARIAATLDNRRLRQERIRAAGTDAALARLGRRLAASASEADVLAVILDGAADALGAQRVSVGLLRDATCLTMHGFPEPQLDLDDAGPVAEALAQGDPVLAETDRWTRHVLPDPHVGDGALVASPLFDDVHQPMGVLILVWAAPRFFDEEDLNTIETLSRLCGQSIVRSQLAGHTAATAELATDMAAARTTADVALLLRGHASRHLGTTVANLRVLDSELSALVPGADSELPPEVAARYERVPMQAATPLTDAVETNTAVWLGDLEQYGARYPDIAPEAARLGLGATAAVPLHDSDGRPVGAVGLAWPAAMRFDHRFRSRVTTLCDLAGQTLERVRLFEAEHAVVASMQRRLLAPLPAIDGVEMAAYYEPAASTVGMGGDWYEAAQLPDGTVLAIVGDVVGHGVEAVAAMAQIQHLLTGLIRAGTAPGELLSVANSMINGPERTYATAVLLHLDPSKLDLGYLNAGHPAALVRHPDGAVRRLDGNQLPMIGLDVPAAGLVRTPMPAGSVILAYTDGMIERRGEPIDESIDRLAGLFAGLVDIDGDLDRALVRLVEQVRSTEVLHRPTTDDIAAILFRVSGTSGPVPSA